MEFHLIDLRPITLISKCHLCDRAPRLGGPSPLKNVCLQARGVCVCVCVCAAFDEIASPHRVDIPTERGRGQSEELCKESDVSVTSIMSHTYG